MHDNPYNLISQGNQNVHLTVHIQSGIIRVAAVRGWAGRRGGGGGVQFFRTANILFQIYTERLVTINSCEWLFLAAHFARHDSSSKLRCVVRIETCEMNHLFRHINITAAWPASFCSMSSQASFGYKCTTTVIVVLARSVKLSARIIRMTNMGKKNPVVHHWAWTKS